MNMGNNIEIKSLQNLQSRLPAMLKIELGTSHFKEEKTLFIYLFIHFIFIIDWQYNECTSMRCAGEHEILNHLLSRLMQCTLIMNQHVKLP